MSFGFATPTGSAAMKFPVNFTLLKECENEFLRLKPTRQLIPNLQIIKGSMTKINIFNVLTGIDFLNMSYRSNVFLIQSDKEQSRDDSPNPMQLKNYKIT